MLDPVGLLVLDYLFVGPPSMRGRWRLGWGSREARPPYPHPSCVSSAPVAVLSRPCCLFLAHAPVPPSHLLCRFRRFRPAVSTPPPAGPARFASVACPAHLARVAASCCCTSSASSHILLCSHPARAACHLSSPHPGGHSLGAHPACTGPPPSRHRLGRLLFGQQRPAVFRYFRSRWQYLSGEEHTGPPSTKPRVARIHLCVEIQQLVPRRAAGRARRAARAHARMNTRRSGAHFVAGLGGK